MTNINQLFQCYCCALQGPWRGAGRGAPGLRSILRVRLFFDGFLQLRLEVSNPLFGGLTEAVQNRGAWGNAFQGLKMTNSSSIGLTLDHPYTGHFTAVHERTKLTRS